MIQFFKNIFSRENSSDEFLELQKKYKRTEMRNNIVLLELQEKELQLKKLQIEKAINDFGNETETDSFL